MVLLLIVAFISGLVTILAPCIWPLLPIVLTASVAGGRRRAFGISFGIVSSFAFFTLVTSYLVSLLKFDPNIFRIFAVLVIGILGLAFVVPAFSKRLEAWVSKLSGKFGPGLNASKKSGFLGGLAVGLALGLVWTPCAGPILATIATLAATKAVNFQIVVVTLVYCLGIGIPLFLFASAGSKFFTKSRFVGKYTGRIQQVFGVVMILTAIAIYTNFDKTLELKLLNVFPSYSQIQNKFEGLAGRQLAGVSGRRESQVLNGGNVSLSNLGPAPEFAGISNWLNSKPLTMAGLRGKVVLVDFWTYTCINCIRTLPYMTSWYEKYNNPSNCSGLLRSSANESLPAGLKDKCFVVVGVHTPEFEFEKNTQNVASALKQFKINYPVAQDNNYKTWDAFGNQYWPADYLIDAKGNIRDVHFGEGNYGETEKAIQTLLVEAGNKVGGNLVDLSDQTPSGQITPETYLGSKRMERFSSNGQVRGGLQAFILPDNLAADYFAYQGTWDVQDEYAQAAAGAELFFNFNASNVYLVMQPGHAGEKVNVYLDGKAVDAKNGGADVIGGEVSLDRDRLYALIRLKIKGRHLLRLQFSGGTKVYAFTFG